MTNQQFLMYCADPFEVGNARFAIADDQMIEMKLPSQIPNDVVLISYDATTLIDELRRSGVKPPQIIDVSDAIRLGTGISRADGGEKHWDFWRRIRSFFNDEKSWKACRDIHEARAIAPPDEALILLLRTFANALSNLWGSVQDEMEKIGEANRFHSIERPVAQMFYHRQYSGIPIASDSLKYLIAEAAAKKYSSYQEVAKILNVSPTGLTYWNVGPFLSSTDLASAHIDAVGYTLRDQMKLASSSSSFAKTFTEYVDASRDLDILMRLADGNGRIYPTIQTVGTITARILLSDPYLQELRKQFRSAISADENFELAYFDYSQFEPGIMASLSGDEELISLYNRGDVYTELSQSIFGNPDQRQLCKKAFLGFSYGMDAQGIARLISAGKGGDDSVASIKSKVEMFFERFSTLEAYKGLLLKDLQTNGYVSSAFGNRRLRISKGQNLNAREKRWALSQKIQGTASLIFKLALIKLENAYGMNAILMPLHDAILMQFPLGTTNHHSSKVFDLMKEAFSEYCQEIDVKITLGNFSG
jgi:DNA polymerase I